MADLGWAMIPVVTVVAFTFMYVLSLYSGASLTLLHHRGIEGIAEEIEMPFGVDHTDLPLDTYCQDLREEIEYVLILPRNYSY